MLGLHISPENYSYFSKNLLFHFCDERYLKIEGKPILIIPWHQSFQKNYFTRIATNIRIYAKDAGLPDLYIIMMVAGFKEDIKSWGADAICDSPPAYVRGDVYAGVCGRIRSIFKSKSITVDY